MLDALTHTFITRLELLCFVSLAIHSAASQHVPGLYHGAPSRDYSQVSGYTSHNQQQESQVSFRRQWGTPTQAKAKVLEGRSAIIRHHLPVHRQSERICLSDVCAAYVSQQVHLLGRACCTCTCTNMCAHQTACVKHCTAAGSSAEHAAQQDLVPHQTHDKPDSLIRSADHRIHCSALHSPTHTCNAPSLHVVAGQVGQCEHLGADTSVQFQGCARRQCCQ